MRQDRAENKERIKKILEDPKQHVILMELLEVVKKANQDFLRHNFGYSGDKLEYWSEFILKKGFPIKVETKYGNFTGNFDTFKSILSIYALFLGSLGLVKYPGTDIRNSINKEDKECAQAMASFFLMVFITKLKKELEGIASESFQLAVTEIKRVMIKSDDGLRETIEQITKSTEKRRKQDSRIKRGGYHGKPGFWDDEKKIEFYQKTDSLPKIKGKSLWKYIFSELMDVDFAPDMIDWLKGRPELKNIPDELFSEAVLKWREYKIDQKITKEEDKPRYFEFRYALYLLNYPDESPFSSLDTYYKQGKSMSKKVNIKPQI